MVHEADAVELDRRAKARGKRDFATIILEKVCLMIRKLILYNETLGGGRGGSNHIGPSLERLRRERLGRL